MKSLDLDVATPEEVSQVLRNAAERFYDSQIDLQLAWHDRNAGRVWGEMAKALESAAIRCEQACNAYL